MRNNRRLCVKFGFQGDHIGAVNLFQSSKQTGWFDVIRAKLYVWKCWITNSTLRAKDKSYRALVLVEGKSVPLITCIRLYQAPCLVLETRREKVKRDSSAAFPHLFLRQIKWLPIRLSLAGRQTITEIRRSNPVLTYSLLTYVLPL